MPPEDERKPTAFMASKTNIKNTNILKSRNISARPHLTLLKNKK